MSVDPAFAAGLFVLGAAAVIVFVVYRLRSHGAQWHLAVQQLSAELERQGRESEHRHQRLREQLLDHERARKDDHGALSLDLERRLSGTLARQSAIYAHLRQALAERLSAHQTRFEQRHAEALKVLNDTLHQGTELTRRQVADALARSAVETGTRLDSLTRRTDERLKQISGEVEKRLSDGFEKTTSTFNDVLKRLALIDEAQKKITELSSNVVSLQEVLSDKRSRGAFGEVQLNALVSNVLPASSYAVQHTLSNGRRADCALFLPAPTGTIVIDSKFPLESYQRMTDLDASEVERRAAARQFKLDVRAHIKAISERYIIAGETSDGAIMFLPAEAVFAEIQAHHPDVVQESHRQRVWMASPTTLVAILNTAAAVLKDEATRQQIHVIRRHLAELAMDFDRFSDRMDKLATHIDQANRDVTQVNVSARKISKRFEIIEKVEMEGETVPEITGDDDVDPASGATG